jgi:hypothetical protein
VELPADIPLDLLAFALARQLVSDRREGVCALALFGQSLALDLLAGSLPRSSSSSHRTAFSRA